ncbi:thiamine/thiamine pyrophosphate ABC transporter permease ThiP [Paroceanicella profunda]|uniref:Thiamine/thiamine pyrophosphate ABC transporter permease ThiP n=1 Tax=Paroceanicella profunda TaxID=2579971 RepID=A0A5B8FUP0_9RHOB|nr:thiamine/thiamine pyrophosphate ABC transporter permease ThiP [Paroceanicella profunda]QDL92095.1 thiamine/thiamine pyrophosphate ABC transporter permease ThiP [Paroceanicella profunda]
MAGRAVALSGGAGRLAGGLALAFVVALCMGTLVPLALAAEPGRGLRPADWTAIRFTLMQAGLSAVLSVALAVPVARALARRRFPGRGLLVTLLGAPFLLPAIVAVFGLIAIWGRSGLASRALGLAGLGPLDIYGLGGVLLGHVFFNLPLVTRLLLQGWAAIPAEHWRLAAQLGMDRGAVFRHLERPMLIAVLPGAALLVFLLCSTSFAVVLALGGGPGASTVELAIYQSLRFDFDLGRAALLGLVQFGICLALAVALLTLGREAGFGPSLGGPVARRDIGGPLLRGVDALAITLAAAFLLLPLGAVVARGLPALLAGLPDQVWPAVLVSLSVAIPSALLSLGLGLALAGLVTGLRGGAWAEALTLMGLAASPFVIGTGLFLVLNPLVDPFALAVPVTLLVNAVMSLPFAMRVLVPALRRAQADYGRLAQSLGMSGFAGFRLAIWPALRRPAGFATGIAAALSMGDLGVITLFADPQTATLPLTMYRLMGAYRMEAAAGAALLLLALSLALFWIFDRGGRWLDRA